MATVGGGGERPLLRPVIETSWRRSKSYGLRRGDEVRAPASAMYDADSRLLRAAAPVLDDACDSLSGLRVGGLLADAGGTLVGRFFGDRSLENSTERIGGGTGAVFDEQNSGTNAIATCLETRAPVNVFGEEHYLDLLRNLDCYGVPIVNPVTRRLEGVIDLMMDAGIADGHRRALEALLDRMVRDISMRLLGDYDPEVQQAVAAFTTLSRRSDDALVLLGRDFVLHNRRALDDLSTSDIRRLESHASEPGTAAETTVTLQSGREVAIQTYQHTAGQPLMMRVRNGVRARPPVPRTRAEPESSSERLADRIEQLALSSAPVLIIGEPGTGRSTAAQAIAGERASVVCASVLAGGLPPEVHSVDPSAEPALIVEEIDRLTADAVTDIALLIRHGRRVVMTLRSGARDEAGYLGGLCTEWLELPPLRERLDIAAQFGEVVRRRTGATVAPVRLQAPAVELLRRHRWPGNLTELANLVDHVLAHRSAGDITIADLPARYQRLTAARPSMTPFEKAEWELIERTLADCGGNKVHTAKRLGISRSKLYARLRFFQIS